MKCQNCCSASARPHGRNRSGTLRYWCPACGKTFSEPRRTIRNRYLSFEKTALVANLLAEGNSMSSTARIAGIERNTVSSLLVEIGQDCHRFLENRIRNVDISHLEIDEIWTFVKKKQKRVKPGDPPEVGDAYTYIALDRDTKLVVTWLLGKRTAIDTAKFIWNVRKATSGKKFQISSDGWEAYEWAIEAGLSDWASYGRIVKVSGPGRVEAVLGNPDVSKIETTFIERFNGTLRLWCKRFNRSTYAFSKDWKMLRWALALQFAHYNFCRIHQTLRTTPTMKAGITRRLWTMGDLLEAACGWNGVGSIPT